MSSNEPLTADVIVPMSSPLRLRGHEHREGMFTLIVACSQLRQQFAGLFISLLCLPVLLFCESVIVSYCPGANGTNPGFSAPDSRSRWHKSFINGAIDGSCEVQMGGQAQK